MNPFTEITLNHYLVLSGGLFALGLAGVFMRRCILFIYMGLEMMLNAAVLAIVAFSRFQPHEMYASFAQPEQMLAGHVMVFFIITVAAAEVAVGLALIVALYRLRQTTNVSDLNNLKF